MSGILVKLFPPLPRRTVPADAMYFACKKMVIFAFTGETAFRDVPADKYYTEAIAWAAEKGITTGVAEGVFGTYEPCTRAHVVTFLYRACGE